MASAAIAQNRVGMELTLQLISQDVGSNTSVVRRRGRVWRNSGTGIWGDGAGWSAGNAGGGGGGSFSYDFRSTYEYVLMQQDFTVYHNADGTASIATNFSVDMNNEYYPGGGTVTEYLTLPTIPRASTPSWSGDIEAGTAETINMNRASSSFTHTVQYNFGGSGWQTIATGVGTSVSWTPPLSLLQYIPNSSSGNGTIRVITYNGGTTIGTKDVTFTLTAPATAVPTINAPTITEDNSAVATVMGAGNIFVQKLSQVDAVVTGAGYQSSTIAAAEFSIGGVSAPSGGTITPQTSGTVVLTSKVTDSRGKTATRTDNITVRAYSTPTINSFLVQRANSSGVVQNEGTYLRVDLNAVVSSLINGTEKNTLGIRMYTRLKGATSWTARNVINHTAISYNNNFLISGAPYAVNQAYDVRIEVFDKFNIAAGQTTIATAAIYMNWAPGGVGLGKYWEKGAIDAAGSVYATQGFYTDSIKVATNFNATLQDGKYYAAAGALNAPLATHDFVFTVNNLGNGRITQEARMGSNNLQLSTVWTRIWDGSAWTRWTRSDGLMIPTSVVGGTNNIDVDGKISFSAATTLTINDVYVTECRGYKLEGYIETSSDDMGGSIEYRMTRNGVRRTSGHFSHLMYTVSNNWGAPSPTWQAHVNVGFFNLGLRRFSSFEATMHNPMDLVSPRMFMGKSFANGTSSHATMIYGTTSANEGTVGQTDGFQLACAGGTATLAGWVRISRLP